MKDAKGHGSDQHGAHSDGVQQVGQPKTYSWTKLPHSMGHVLCVNGNLADQVGGVRAQAKRDGGNEYIGSYSYPQSTGNNPSGYSFHGSVQGAKNYVEGSLAKFWEPPNVRKG